MTTRVTGGLAAGILAALMGGAAGAGDPPRIKWDRGVFAGFERAAKGKKPLVVYVRVDYSEADRGPSPPCEAIEAVLRGPGASALAGDAAWAWQTAGDEDTKGNAARFVKTLKVTHVPAVVVLDAAPESLSERGRIVGKVPEAEFLKRLRALLAGGPGAPADVLTRRPGVLAPPKEFLPLYLARPQADDPTPGPVRPPAP